MHIKDISNPFNSIIWWSITKLPLSVFSAESNGTEFVVSEVAECGQRPFLYIMHRKIVLNKKEIANTLELKIKKVPVNP